MKGYIELKEIQDQIENAPTLEVKDGKIFVEEVETIDPELIGMAFKDLVEENPKASIFIANEKRLISMVYNNTELAMINEFAIKEWQWQEIEIRYNVPFDCNNPSTAYLYNLLMMIKKGELIFKSDLNE